jgi:hypothetical protein
VSVSDSRFLTSDLRRSGMLNWTPDAHDPRQNRRH